MARAESCFGNDRLEQPWKRFLGAVIFALSFVWGAFFVGAAQTAESLGTAAPATEVYEALARLDAAQDGLKTFRAEVVETREMALFNEPEVREGTILIRLPGDFRWEYSTPEKSTYVLANGTLTGWIPASKRVESMNVGKREKRIRRLVALGQDARSLQREFDVSLARPSTLEGTDELVLVPKSRRVRRHLAEIRLWISHALGLPKQVRYTTEKGDVTRLELHAVEINPEIDERAFEVDVPADATRVEGVTSLGWGAQ